MSLALAVLPQAMLAEAPLAPMCVEGGAEWYLGTDYGNGLRLASKYPSGGNGDQSVAYLLSCTAGRAVEARQAGTEAYIFYDLADGMVRSSERYTLEDLAKLTREAGWSAKVVTFSKGACICGVSY